MGARQLSRARSLGAFVARGERTPARTSFELGFRNVPVPNPSSHISDQAIGDRHISSAERTRVGRLRGCRFSIELRLSASSLVHADRGHPLDRARTHQLQPSKTIARSIASTAPSILAIQRDLKPSKVCIHTLHPIGGRPYDDSRNEAPETAQRNIETRIGFT